MRPSDKANFQIIRLISRGSLGKSLKFFAIILLLVIAVGVALALEVVIDFDMGPGRALTTFGFGIIENLLS